MLNVFLSLWIYHYIWQYIPVIAFFPPFIFSISALAHVETNVGDSDLSDPRVTCQTLPIIHHPKANQESKVNISLQYKRSYWLPLFTPRLCGRTHRHTHTRAFTNADTSRHRQTYTKSSCLNSETALCWKAASLQTWIKKGSDEDVLTAVNVSNHLLTIFSVIHLYLPEM